MDWTAFWSHWGWPLVTGLIGFFFTFLLLFQFKDRRKPHQLAWSVGFLFYAVAALMEAYSEFTGDWDTAVYRIYIVLAASLVGYLGLGSVYLIPKKRIWGHIFLVYVVLATGIFFYGTFTADLVMEDLVAGITVGGKGLGKAMSFPRVMSLFLNIPGTIFLLGGAILSILKFAPKKHFRYRVWANVFIALGTIIIAAAGSMARAGYSVGLYPAEMLGAFFLLVGFLRAGTLKKGAQLKKMEEEQE
jgi:hypothetical protein